jgi:hypothetical protein
MVVNSGSKSIYEAGTKKVSCNMRYHPPNSSLTKPCQLIDRMSAQVESFRQITFTGDYTDARKHFDDFAKYPLLKREFTKDRQLLATNFGNIQTRLKTAGIREYVPAAGVRLEVSHPHGIAEGKRRLIRDVGGVGCGEDLVGIGHDRIRHFESHQ